MESDHAPCERLFTCTRCGDCCQGYGGTYLSPADVESIARYLGVTTGQFVARYTTMSGNRRLISQAASGYCVFWDQVCTIHPVKPKMCRQWPYIRSILVDVGNWRAMAASCPGMKADATDEEILACVQKEIAEKEAI
jgi:uncharacterized protein